jgi:engulfment/cell motility protein 1
MTLSRQIVHILVNQNIVNICRPATAIVRKLVAFGPQSAPAPVPGEEATQRTIYSYGFDVVWPQIYSEPSFFKVLNQRLTRGDYLLIQSTIALINSLMHHVTDTHYDDFTDELEKNEVSRAVNVGRSYFLQTCQLETYQGNDTEHDRW